MRPSMALAMHVPCLCSAVYQPQECCAARRPYDAAVLLCDSMCIV